MKKAENISFVNLDGESNLLALHDADRALAKILSQIISVNVDLLERVWPALELAKVQFVISNDENRDAFAFQNENRKTVSIDIGLLRLFWERAAVAVNLPSVFSEFMPAKNNNIPDWLSDDCDTVPAMASWQVAEDRKDYCIDIFQHMLEYLVLHELAHHMRGHLELIRSDQTYAALGEISARRSSETNKTAKSDFNIQDLELDADAHALDLTVTALKAKFPDNRHDWNFDTISETLFLLMFSQILVSQAFDDIDQTQGHRPLDLHPAPQYRSINFTNLAVHTFHSLAGGEWEKYRELHDAAWTEAGHVAKFLGFPSGRWFGGDKWALVTDQYQAVEQRYFKATQMVDAFIDIDNNLSEFKPET